MAEQQEQVDVDEGDNRPGYKVPAQVSLQELKSKDAEDESLQKYKAALLGTSEQMFPETDKCLIIRRMEIVFPNETDRPPATVDLQDEANMNSLKFEAKEGVTYQIVVYFDVQKEIVSGLKLINTVTRKGIKVDKHSFVIGSYGPNKEKDKIQKYTTPKDEFPAGMLSRGEYKVHSLFTDDDKNEHCKWDWTFKLKKDWKDDKGE